MMVESMVISLALLCEPRKSSTCREDEVVQFSCSALPFETVFNNASFNSLETNLADSLEAALCKDFASIPSVRHVLTEHAHHNLLVWIALDNPERDIRDKVYQKQLSLLDGFPEVNFDFNLIPANGRDPKEIATGAEVVYSRS